MSTRPRTESKQNWEGGGGGHEGLDPQEAGDVGWDSLEAGGGSIGWNPLEAGSGVKGPLEARDQED